MTATPRPCLLVIDAQQIYTTEGSELYCRDSPRTIDRINELVDFFQSQKLPIIYVRHEHARDGSDLGRMFDFAGEAADFNFKAGLPEVELDPRLQRPANAPIVIKRRYSAFEGTDLAGMLARLRVTRVVICGFMTNFCCESTAREAHDKDYFVTFVTDATGCPDLEGLDQERIREVVAQLLGAGFAIVCSARDIADYVR